MNYLLEILLKLSAVTDTRKRTIMTSSSSSLAAHFVNPRNFTRCCLRLVPNMGRIIPGEICDQFGVKFCGYSAPGRDGHRSRECDGLRNVMWCVTGAEFCHNYLTYRGLSRGERTNILRDHPDIKYFSLNEWPSADLGQANRILILMTNQDDTMIFNVHFDDINE